MEQDIRDIIKEKLYENDELKGGYADNMDVEDIANKHGVDVDQTQKELKKGIEVEYEHTNDEKKSKEIALDHLYEMPDYYTKLLQMEEGQHEDLKGGNEEADDSQREIKNKIKEGELFSTTLDIHDDEDKKIGYVTIGRTNEDIENKAIELVDVHLEDDHDAQDKIRDILNSIWATFPEVYRLFLTPTQESRPFWERMGATRLNDSYFIISRGN